MQADKKRTCSNQKCCFFIASLPWRIRAHKMVRFDSKHFIFYFQNGQAFNIFYGKPPGVNMCRLFEESKPTQFCSDRSTSTETEIELKFVCFRWSDHFIVAEVWDAIMQKKKALRALFCWMHLQINWLIFTSVVKENVYFIIRQIQPLKMYLLVTWMGSYRHTRWAYDEKGLKNEREKIEFNFFSLLNVHV